MTKKVRLDLARLLGAPAALLALAAAGCGPSPQRLPDRVNIAIVDATIAPAKENGQAWDGIGPVPVGVLQGVSRLLAAAPARGRAELATKTGAVVAELAAAVASGLQAPDPKGYAELLVAGTARRLNLPEQQDTFRPTWYAITFDQVPLVQDIRIRVQLFDADTVGNDDPIGLAELTYDDLLSALSGEQVTQIRMVEQTRGHILYVGISVAGQ